MFGDASSSMQAAIEAATIFASMVSACLSGELSFFNGNVVPSPHDQPQTVRETLRVCHQIRACGCTSLASALWPYYQKAKVVDLFVMVTDEEENTRFQGHMFADLLAKYRQDVNPQVQLIVVTVGNGDGRFRTSLASQEIEYKTVTIDGTRPDLTKFDGLVGRLAAMSNVAEPTQGEGEPLRGEKESDDFVLGDED